jgi:hypothetical protein
MSIKNETFVHMSHGFYNKILFKGSLTRGFQHQVFNNRFVRSKKVRWFIQAFSRIEYTLQAI